MLRRGPVYLGCPSLGAPGASFARCRAFGNFHDGDAMADEPMRSTVHFLISNQSGVVLQAELRVTFDEKEILRKSLVRNGGHAFAEISLTVRHGRHSLGIEEAVSGLVEQRPVDVDGDLWIGILFFGGQDNVRISVSREPMTIQ